ncbi:MAG: alpha-galactosidase [Lachnospiraceae bacterium]|nr:alpha-galactosidase [Lachnospiraceae bacterium]
MDCKYIKPLDNNTFVLDTENTTYAFRVMENCRYLEHLYYGRKIHIDTADGLVEQHAFAPGNSIVCEKDCDCLSLEDVCLEISSLGKGDIREPFIEAVMPDGSTTLDFKYENASVRKGKKLLETLPSAYDEAEEAEQLIVDMKDENNGIALSLIYSVFPSSNVIIKSVIVRNVGGDPVRLTRVMSNQVDYDTEDFVFTSFNGAWAREMNRHDTVLNHGKIVNSSYTGTSSNRANPYVMLSKENTSEGQGECYGFNLIYSGNHYEAVEVNGYGKSRFVQGINPQNFEFLLLPGDFFESPEAIMSYAKDGLNALSHNMHSFIREHIVRGKYKKKERPVLLNSWEASYFDIDKSGLLKLAKEGKKVGIELFVMDDGWFGERNDDSHSLGDWEVNEKKLPGGLKGIASEIKKLGMDFGIWVEPEMISVNSKLYQNHPEWAMDIPGKPHAEGRNQRVLDLCNEEVQNYVIESMTKVFKSAEISYVKWDMNRIISDYYSRTLGSDRQKEVGHRYVLGLYRCMDELTRRFPDILFEGCAAGGNRFDLGMLCYFPQIWASDNTDAICRAEIQKGYSYGYPQSVFTAHVSGAPNHQTLRKTPLETRFDIASFGILGYECNLCDMKKEDKDAIAEQIEVYKKWRKVLQFGTLFRNDDGSNHTQWTIVSEDGKKAVGLFLQKLVNPNWQYACFKAKGLKSDALYHFYSREVKINIKEFGDLVNTVAPIHIKPDSLMHNIAAKFIKMDSAKEDHKMYGDALMYAGVKLKQGFGGTGYNEEVRYFQDFCSKLYFIEECDA